MTQTNIPQPAPDMEKGYQPQRGFANDGYQPARALNSTPPKGGSGVPNPPSATPSTKATGA